MQKETGVTGCCLPGFRTQKPAVDPTQKVHEYCAVTEALQRHLICQDRRSFRKLSLIQGWRCESFILGRSCSISSISSSIGWESCLLTSNPLRDKMMFSFNVLTSSCKPKSACHCHNDSEDQVPRGSSKAIWGHWMADGGLMQC